ncbi:MAG TPA: DUF2491 family protein [Allosphingosinicella sp.]
MSHGQFPPAPAALPVVEGVTIGRTVMLDPRAWRRHGEETFFGLDRGDLAITGQGYLKLDELTHVHRFYTDEEVMLQAVTGSAEGGSPDDVTIFHGLWSQYPRDSNDRAAFLQRMRRPTFEHEGVSWDRFWLPGYENDQEPVRLWEAVYEDRSGRPARHVAQTCMLYSRELPAGGSEMLLALEVAPEQGEIVQELMVGLALTAAEFNA